MSLRKQQLAAHLHWCKTMTSSLLTSVQVAAARESASECWCCADVRQVQLLVGEEELAVRREQWQPKALKYKRGTLATYAKLVSSAATGACLE